MLQGVERTHTGVCKAVGLDALKVSTGPNWESGGCSESIPLLGLKRLLVHTGMRETLVNERETSTDSRPHETMEDIEVSVSLLAFSVEKLTENEEWRIRCLS